MKKQCLVINLFGAPGAGKSTGAAYIYSKLKMLGINAELVREYAKDKTWENNLTPLKAENQSYIFGKQFYKMNIVRDQVDVIVTDAPLFHSVFYNHSEALGEAFNQIVMQCFSTFQNVNYMVTRSKPYNSNGRTQTESESIAMAEQFKSFCDEQCIQYTSVKGTQEGYDSIVEQIAALLDQNKNQ